MIFGLISRLAIGSPVLALKNVIGYIAGWAELSLSRLRHEFQDRLPA
jgi:hypothetical protein